MTENAADTTGTSLFEEPAPDSLPSVMRLGEGGDSVPPPQAVPVPTEDVVACAKSKCATCFGKGKLVFHAPGGTTAKTKVCACAIRQFIKLHRRRLLIDKVGRFFYLPTTEVSEAPEISAKVAEEASALVDGLSDYNRDRLRGMFERIAQYEGELAVFDERYARMAAPIKDELLFVQGERAAEATRLQQVVYHHASLGAAVDALGLEIEDLVAKLYEAKQRKLALEAEVATDLKTIEDAEVAALPGLRKQAGVEERLAGVARKRQKARRPAEQKIESLRKRIAHLAAINAIPEAVLAELAIPAADVLDVADEAADEIAAEVGAETGEIIE